MVLSDRARQALGESPRPGCPVCRQRHRQLHVAVECRRRAMTSYPMALYLHTTFQKWIAPRHVPDQDEDRPAPTASMPYQSAASGLRRSYR
jgi:hypothetical protein